MFTCGPAFTTNPLLWFDNFSSNTLGNYNSAAQGTLATWGITSNQMVGTGGTQAILTAKVVTFLNGYVQASVTYADDGGIILRSLDANNYYLLTFHDGSATSAPNTYSIYKCVGGTFTPLSLNQPISGGWTRGVLKVFRFAITSSTLTVKIDDTLINTVTDSSLTSSGFFGMRNGSSGSSSKYSVFLANKL